MAKKDVLVLENWWIAESPEGIEKKRDRMALTYYRLLKMRAPESVIAEAHRLWHALNRSFEHGVRTCWDACPSQETLHPCSRRYR